MTLQFSTSDSCCLRSGLFLMSSFSPPCLCSFISALALFLCLATRVWQRSLSFPSFLSLSLSNSPCTFLSLLLSLSFLLSLTFSLLSLFSHFVLISLFSPTSFFKLSSPVLLFLFSSHSHVFSLSFCLSLIIFSIYILFSHFPPFILSSPFCLLFVFPFLPCSSGHIFHAMLNF